MNCSNCQNPIVEGEKFCGNCGSPSGNGSFSNIQQTSQQGVTPRKNFLIILGGSGLLIIIALFVLWFFTRDNKSVSVSNHQLPEANVPGSDSRLADVTNTVPDVSAVVNSNIEKISFDFLGTKFFFDAHADTNKSYYFYPDGESKVNWKQEVTIVRQPSTGGIVTPEFAKAFSKEFIKIATSNGAVINSQSELNGTTVWIYTVSGKNNAVSINKMFAYKNEVVGVLYNIKINGNSEQEIKASAIAQLEKLKTAQDQFISAKFPFPWEIAGK
jgi:hypothetical protein